MNEYCNFNCIAEFRFILNAMLDAEPNFFDKSILLSYTTYYWVVLPQGLGLVKTFWNKNEYCLAQFVKWKKLLNGRSYISYFTFSCLKSVKMLYAREKKISVSSYIIFMRVLYQPLFVYLTMQSHLKA